jgi:hypothetical protein
MTSAISGTISSTCAASSSASEQPALFTLVDDVRPASQRTCADRYQQPLLFDLQALSIPSSGLFHKNDLPLKHSWINEIRYSLR